jgi:CheY-like chemotaxis protein
MDRTWVLSIAPLEYDPTLSTDDQVNALVCSCDDGWIFAIPVGSGFNPTRLTQEEMTRLLVVAEGNARQVSDWEPSRSEVRTVREPTSGRLFQVRVLTREWAAPAALRSDAPRARVLLFQERGGAWSSSIPLPPGKPIESLSREDLLHLLWPALAMEGSLLSAGARAERPRPSAAPERASRLVLLVEDHRELRRIYRFALEQAGFGVVEAGDGEEALSIVEQFGSRLGAVVTDVVMPRVGGRELVWRLSETHPSLPVILVTGLLDRRQVVHGMAPEPAWFLRKPFDPSELVALVRKALGAPPSPLLQA